MSSLITFWFATLWIWKGTRRLTSVGSRANMKTTGADSIDSTMLAPVTKLLTATLHGSDLAAKRTIQLQTTEVFDDNHK